MTPILTTGGRFNVMFNLLCALLKEQNEISGGGSDPRLTCGYSCCCVFHISISHDQHFTSACHIIMSHQHVTSACRISMSHQHVTSACHIRMSHQHVTSACHISMSHQHVTSACHISTHDAWFKCEEDADGMRRRGVAVFTVSV